MYTHQTRIHIRVSVNLTWYCYSFILWRHTGHLSYLGFLYVEHTHNNPIVHVFVSLLSAFQSERTSQYGPAERRSQRLAYDTMQPDLETALLVSVKASSNCGWSGVEMCVCVCVCVHAWVWVWVWVCMGVGGWVGASIYMDSPNVARSRGFWYQHDLLHILVQCYAFFLHICLHDCEKAWSTRLNAMQLYSLLKPANRILTHMNLQKHSLRVHILWHWSV